MKAPRAQPAEKSTPKPWRVNRRLLDFCRTAHIYLTMLGLLVLLLFGFTGFTLNHENWFNAATPRVSESKAQVPLELIARKDTLRLVEYVRQSQHISGTMTGFDDNEDSYTASFRAPGQYWDVDIAKATGEATLRIEAYNFFAVLDNLHRGKYTGIGWRIIMDVCAALIVLACVTGVVLWLALPKRRRLGVAALAVGTVAALLVYLLFVPGPDEVRPAQPTATTPAL